MHVRVLISATCGTCMLDLQNVNYDLEDDNFHCKSLSAFLVSYHYENLLYVSY